MEQALPDDILYLLSKSVTQADRCLLVRLNRHFNELLTPVLYRSIKVDAQASVLLTKTLLKKRHLAQYVRALSLGRLPFQVLSTILQYAPERTENASNAVFIPESLEIMRNVTRSPDEETQWKKDLMCDHEEAWAGVLLLLLGGLQELHMKFRSSYRYTQTVISQADAMQFPRLETVRADQVSDAIATRVHCALRFFRFPAMRVFTSEGLREQPAEAPKRLSPISSSITHLRLEQNMLTADTLRTLILSCPNLERFEYHRRYMETASFRIAFLHDCLSPRRDTLLALWINYRYSSHQILYQQILDPVADQWMGSFANYGRLRELRIPLQCLLDISPGSQYPQAALLTTTFPLTLEWLYIHDCYESHLPMLVSQLLQLIACHDRQVPRLGRLDLENKRIPQPEPHTGWRHFKLVRLAPESDGVVEPLRTACDDAGIEFYIQDGRQSSYEMELAGVSNPFQS